MRLTPRAPTLECLKALWHCGTMALWHCKDLWHCGTVVLWSARRVVVSMCVGSFSRDLPPFLRHCLWDKFDLSLSLSLSEGQAPCARTQMANRQKVGRLGVLGALWQAKIFKKCQKDTAFSSKIAYFCRTSKVAHF